jgi:hypothetical protein
MVTKSSIAIAIASHFIDWLASEILSLGKGYSM